MMARPLPPARNLRARLIALALMVVVVVAAVVLARPPRDLTIETGPIDGSYHADAQSYRQILTRQGINLEIRPRANSLAIVRDVGDKQSGVDVGFIAQDVSGSRDAPVFSLGQIELQPLFIFASAELGRRTVVGDLRGRKIVMPPTDSATTAAAVKLLELYDITPDNSTFVFMPLADAVQKLRAGLFDAGIFMLAPANPLIRALAMDTGLLPVPITEVKAVTNHMPFLRPIVLPRGMYNIADADLPSDTPAVAASVGVVVRAGLSPYLIYALLDAMAKVHRDPTLLSGAGEFPTIAGSQLAVHPLAADFYRSGVPWRYRELPPWLASAFDQYQLVLLGVVLVGGLGIVAVWLADTCLSVVALLAQWRRGRRVGPVTQAVSDSRSTPSADASGRPVVARGASGDG
jgi:TRAP-type uncharacterized transport system substrate-binding protein